MIHYKRTRSKIDTNQTAIVKALRQIPNVSVQMGHDDILVGYKGKTMWYEIKALESLSRRSGMLKLNTLKDSQIELVKHWQGHYRIVWKLEQILDDLGIK